MDDSVLKHGGYEKTKKIAIAFRQEQKQENRKYKWCESSLNLIILFIIYC